MWTARQAPEAAVDAALQGAKLLAVLALALADCAWIIWRGLVSHVLAPLWFASIEWGGGWGAVAYCCAVLLSLLLLCTMQPLARASVAG